MSKIEEAIEQVVSTFDWDEVLPNAPSDVVLYHRADAYQLLKQAYETEDTVENGRFVARYCGCSGKLELAYVIEDVVVRVEEDDDDPQLEW